MFECYGKCALQNFFIAARERRFHVYQLTGLGGWHIVVKHVSVGESAYHVNMFMKESLLGEPKLGTTACPESDVIRLRYANEPDLDPKVTSHSANIRMGGTRL